jgi:hypothetical protein
MTLYQGENAEGIIKYIETDDYLFTMRCAHADDPNAHVTRPLYELLEDDGKGCTDETCFCYIIPHQALASISWTEEAEIEWLKYGVPPTLPTTIYKAYIDNWRRRDFQWRTSGV